MSTPVNTNIVHTYNNSVFNDNHIKKGVNQIVFSKFQLSEERNNHRHLFNSQHPHSCNPESEEIFKERKYITRWIVPKTEERQNWFTLNIFIPKYYTIVIFAKTLTIINFFYLSRR